MFISCFSFIAQIECPLAAAAVASALATLSSTFSSTLVAQSQIDRLTKYMHMHVYVPNLFGLRVKPIVCVHYDAMKQTIQCEVSGKYIAPLLASVSMSCLLSPSRFPFQEIPQRDCTKGGYCTKTASLLPSLLFLARPHAHTRTLAPTNSSLRVPRCPRDVAWHSWVAN